VYSKFGISKLVLGIYLKFEICFLSFFLQKNAKVYRHSINLDFGKKSITAVPIDGCGNKRSGFRNPGNTQNS